MNFIDKFRNYKLKFSEKFNNSWHRQVMRLIKMLYRYPIGSIKGGILKVMINLTYECHCSCDYCWCGSYDRYPDKELSYLEIRMLLNEIAEYPSIFTLISFVGGEPLLREDIYELIDYTTKKGLFVEVETNGMLLSRATVLQLKKVGLHHIFVRIEGSTAEKHDSISKVKGCFEKTTNGIKICVEEGVSCSIFMNAHKEKIKEGELSKIINIGRKLKVTSVRIIYPTLAGRWVNAEEQRLTTKEKDEVKKLLRPDFVYLESSYVVNIESDRLCPAYDKKFFHISCYGEVQPCPFVPLSFGNIRSQSLKGILRFMRMHPLFKKEYKGCLMNNIDFRRDYILPARLHLSYKNINMSKDEKRFASL